jgi:polar amino acid transport system substrate-binding protein
MKKTSTLLSSSLGCPLFKGALLLGAVLVSGLSPLRAETITLCADNWFPYNGAPGATPAGYVIEIVNAITEKNGDKFDYQIMPWKRAVAVAEKGEINGVIGGLVTDTPGFVFPEEPIGLSGTSAFVKKGSNWKYDGVASLKDKKLAVVDSYSYGDDIDPYIKENMANGKLIDVNAGEAPEALAIKKLQAGRVDVYVSDPNVFWATVKTMGLGADEFVLAGEVAAPDPIFIALSPKRDDSKAIAEKITTGIREMRASGALATILAKYGVADWGK